MDNLLLMKKDEEVEKLSKELGFTRTLFLDEDLIVVESKSKKEAINKIKSARRKGKLILFRAEDEELLRFALEKTQADIVFGIENINPKDSVHFVRGGMDQIVCRIAAEKGKIIAFSFRDILLAANRPKLLARMRFNIKLCSKYKVKILFSNFSKEKMEMRAVSELLSFWRILGGVGKENLQLPKHQK